MFTLTIMVEDKNIAEFLHRLGPLATIHSIVSDSTSTKLVQAFRPNGPNGKAFATGTKGKVTVENIVEALRTHNVVRFKSSMFREILKGVGLNPVSCGYYIKQLHRAGFISKLGKGTNMSYQLADAGA